MSLDLMNMASCKRRFVQGNSCDVPKHVQEKGRPWWTRIRGIFNIRLKYLTGKTISCCIKYSSVDAPCNTMLYLVRC